MIRDPVLMGGSKRIIAQKPRLWKANFANDTNCSRALPSRASDRKGRGRG